MQTDLRLILLVVGLVIVAAIFFDGNKRRKVTESGASKTQDSLEPEQSVDTLLQESTLPPLGPMVGFFLLANHSLGFSGKALLANIISHQLQYHTKKKIYEAHSLDSPHTLYHLASMVEPGTFERQTLAQKNYPGVMLFMLVPEECDSDMDLGAAFEAMLETAYNMADALNAELCDLDREPLSVERIEQIRFQLRERMMA